MNKTQNEHIARDALLIFLRELAKDNGFVCLENFARYQHLLSSAMDEEIRWKRLAAIDGESFSESVLAHTFNQVFLGDMMFAIEEKHSNAQGIDRGLLLSALNLHDTAESLVGDIALFYKTKEDDEEENSAFVALLAPLLLSCHTRFKESYALSSEAKEAKKAGRPLSSISRTGLFFHAVEIVGYCLKAMHEVKHGKFVYVEVFRNFLYDIMILRAEFRSVESFFPDSIMKLIGNFMKEHNSEYNRPK